MSVSSFSKCLTLMCLSLASKDVKKMAAPFDRWVAEAEPLLRSYGTYGPFKTLVAKFKKSGYEFTEEFGHEFKPTLAAIIKKLVADPAIKTPEVLYVRNASTYLNRDSDPAWEHLKKNSSVLGDNQLASIFLNANEKDVADLSVQQTLENIVFKLTKRKNDIYFDVDEVLKFKASHPKTMLKHAQLTTELKKRYLPALLKFVRISGKELIDVASAKSYLNAMGCDYLPTGFVGKVDEHGKLYTTAGLVLEGRMSGHLEMNPKYDPATNNTWYAGIVGNTNKLRTAAMNVKNRAERHGKVRVFAGGIDEHRKNWIADLISPDQHIKFIAAIVETIHLTWGRIGGDKNKVDGKPTFGVSTLRAHQVTLTPTSVSIEYPGKKKTINRHTILGNTPNNRKLISIYKEALDGKGPNEKLWIARTKQKSGVMKLREINGSADTNKYLRSIGVQITIHDFRHAAATKVAIDLVKACPFTKTKNPGQKAVEAWLKAECTKIGVMLHHRTGSGDKEKVTASTAISSYIDPSVLRKFFTDLGLKQPDWIPELDE